MYQYCPQASRARPARSPRSTIEVLQQPSRLLLLTISSLHRTRRALRVSRTRRASVPTDGNIVSSLKGIAAAHLLLQFAGRVSARRSVPDTMGRPSHETAGPPATVVGWRVRRTTGSTYTHLFSGGDDDSFTTTLRWQPTHYCRRPGQTHSQC